MVIDNLPIENTGQIHMLSTGKNPVKMLVHLPLINVCRYPLVVKGNQIMKIRGVALPSIETQHQQLETPSCCLQMQTLLSWERRKQKNKSERPADALSVKNINH